VDWEEFKVMFYRVRKDKSGWEPRRLFAVVEFMMHDSMVKVTPW
jgi:calmodulin